MRGRKWGICAGTWRFGEAGVALVLLAVLVSVGPAMTAERLALVIGNSAYQNTPHLPNPANDAKAVAEALTDLGFTVTGPLYDLGKTQLDAALGAFGNRAQVAEAVVVFFAGHGLEARGRNYLIPVDARVERDTAASLEAVALDVMLDQIAGPRGYRLVILDACRDNPLANRMQRADGTRAIYRGLGRVEPEGQTYIAYAARDGTRARDDGGGGHSPFTAALLKYLKEPLPLPNLFGAVREDVLEATQRQQEPWLYGAFGRHSVYLAATPPSPPSQPQTTVITKIDRPTIGGAWEIRNGNWEISNGNLRSQGGEVDSEILYKKFISDNYMIEVNAMPLDGAGKSAIIFCHTGKNHFYQLEISASDSEVFLWKSVNWRKIDNIKMPIFYNTWYRLKIIVKNEKAHFFVNDKVVFTEEIPCNNDHLVGLRSAWTTSYFNNFTVTTQPRSSFTGTTP